LRYRHLRDFLDVPEPPYEQSGTLVVSDIFEQIKDSDFVSEPYAVPLTPHSLARE